MTEYEVLAVVEVCRYLRSLIWGRKVIILIDHKPLSYIVKYKDTNQTVMRWCMEFQKYDLTVTYKTVKDNANDYMPQIKEICQRSCRMWSE